MCQNRLTVQDINAILKVNLNPCFTSPSDIQSYQINQQVKAAFIQAFINRLKNKLAKVQLLSSEMGYVLTVADLEDSLNFLNSSI